MTTAQATRPAKTLTQEQWEARAIELAYAHHLINTETHLGEGDDDEEMFTVRSDSKPTEPHMVRVYRENRCVCDYMAAQHSRPCGHAGAALHWCEQRDGISHLRHPYNEANRQVWLRATGRAS